LKANAKIQKYKMIFLELKIRKRGTELIEWTKREAKM
jgi:hypothetical protein